MDIERIIEEIKENQPAVSVEIIEKANAFLKEQAEILCLADQKTLYEAAAKRAAEAGQEYVEAEFISALLLLDLYRLLPADPA